MKVGYQDLSWPGGLLVQVSNLLLFTSALIRSSALHNVSATIVDLPRLEIQKLAPSVIDVVTEFSTGELVGMEGVLAGRCNFLSQQQAMRVYIGLGRSGWIS